MKSIRSCNQNTSNGKWTTSIDGSLPSEPFRHGVLGHPFLPMQDKEQHQSVYDSSIESDASAMTSQNRLQLQGSTINSIGKEVQEGEEDCNGRQSFSRSNQQESSNIPAEYIPASQDGLECLLQACELLEIKEKQYKAPSPSKINKRTRPLTKAVGEVAVASSDCETRAASKDGIVPKTRYPRKGKAISSSPVRRGPERGVAISGPCTNPDCEHPFNSPQWRKGPPEHPVLCNACGTRWLRNGTLKALVPKRGIRYGKLRSKSPLKLASAAPDQFAPEGSKDEKMECNVLETRRQESLGIQRNPELSGNKCLTLNLERSEQIRIAAVIAATQAAQHVLATGHIPLPGPNSFHQGDADNDTGAGQRRGNNSDDIEPKPPLLHISPLEGDPSTKIVNKSTPVFSIQAVAGPKKGC